MYPEELEEVLEMQLGRPVDVQVSQHEKWQQGRGRLKSARVRKNAASPAKRTEACRTDARWLKIDDLGGDLGRFSSVGAGRTRRSSLSLGGSAENSTSSGLQMWFTGPGTGVTCWQCGRWS